MKRPLLFLLLSLISVAAFGQKIRFCDSTNEWRMVHADWNHPYWMSYKLQYDTGIVAINGMTYRTLNGILIREDTALNQILYCRKDSTEEVLYNYNWQKGDTVHYNYDTLYNKQFYYLVDSVGQALISGDTVKFWKMKYLPSVSTSNGYYEYFVIEGIGCTIGPIGGLMPGVFENDDRLSCFTNRGVQPSVSPVLSFFDNTTSCTLSIQGVSASQPASVYPNPITPSTRIKLPYEMNNGIVQIINTIGQVVWQRSVTNEKEIWIGDKIDVPGMYYYKITGNDGKQLQGKLNKE